VIKIETEIHFDSEWQDYTFEIMRVQDESEVNEDINAIDVGWSIAQNATFQANMKWNELLLDHLENIFSSLSNEITGEVN
jgi:hypothetical protein